MAQESVFLSFVVEGSSLSRRFLQGRHGTSDSDEGHDFDCFQCVQVRRRDGGLETQGSQGRSRGCDGCGIGRIKKKHGSFKLAGMLALKLKKKPATPARKGVNPFTKEPCVFKAKPASKTVRVLAMKKLKDAVN